MGLEIIPYYNAHGRDWFFSSETISGTVELVLKRPSAISQIVLYLEGKIKVAVRPSGSCQESSFRKSERALSKLFVKQWTLHGSDRSQDGPDCTPLGAGHHSFKFGLDLPDVNPAAQDNIHDGQANRAPLPASFKVATDVLQAEISYALRVVVIKPGLLSPNKCARYNIEVRPAATCSSIIESQLEPLRIVRYLDLAPSAARKTSISNEDGLPLYAPSLLFEVDLPGSKVIFPGDHIELGLALTVPGELRYLFASMTLVRLTIRVQITITALVGTTQQSYSKYIECCNVKGLIPLSLPLDQPRIVFPKTLWQYHTYPNMSASFQLAEVQRKHSLEIIVDFASGSLDRIHTIATCTDVLIDGSTHLPTELPPPYA